MKNLLFKKRVRVKKKSLFNIFMFYPYYENEKISLKEKLYTLWYNLNRYGKTTKGECDWSLRIMDIDYDLYEKIKKEFELDYIEYELSKI